MPSPKPQDHHVKRNGLIDYPIPCIDHTLDVIEALEFRIPTPHGRGSPESRQEWLRTALHDYLEVVNRRPTLSKDDWLKVTYWLQDRDLLQGTSFAKIKLLAREAHERYPTAPTEAIQSVIMKHHEPGLAAMLDACRILAYSSGQMHQKLNRVTGANL